MRKFVARLLIFSTPLLLLFAFCEYSLRNITSSYKDKRDGLLAQKTNIEILILGNSHAACGINPQLLKRPAYNLATGAQTLLYDKQLTLKYIDSLPKLKYVIISLDYPSLYWGVVKEFDFFYYRYYGINLSHKSFLKENLSHFFYVYRPRESIELIRKRKSISFNFVNGYNNTTPKDFSSLTDTLGKLRVKFFNSIIENNKKEHSYICQELESFIVFLKQRQITPILITAPVYKYFNDNLNDSIAKSNVAYANMLCRKYNLIYLNSANDSSFQYFDFLDNDHLNADGARKFTSMVDSLIN